MAKPSLNEADNRRQLKILSERIIRAFPPRAPRGAILAGGDKGPWTLEQFHEEDLLNNLRDKLWTQVPPEIIARHLGDFVLLTADGFATYIPAWLLYALYNDNQGAEFIAHTFTPNEADGSFKIRPLSVEMFRALDPSQRGALRDFLIYLSEFHPVDYIADRAAAAVDAIADLIAIFKSSTP
jgi:hypothetical protein